MCERSVCSWRVVAYETAGSRWYGAAGLKSESSDADKMYSSNGKELSTVDEWYISQPAVNDNERGR